MTGNAVIDESGKFRFLLEREWAPLLPRVLFIMINPSTADAEQDDPTIRRCVDFAKRWNFGSLSVVNLFGFRSTDRLALQAWRDTVVGNYNDEWIKRAAVQAAAIVAAWGNLERWQRPRAQALLETVLKEYPIWCLGKTKAGDPRHPLYVRGDTKLQPFRGMQ
ncbi:MAG TPA: DUF1643 domain-containing protein [Candidatus Acidoferrales bacterium]|nr:DUF1643 domain-containing protein [Candidatus Acidoferrales bacterium]